MNEFVDLLQKFAFNLAVAILPILAGFAVAALRALVKKWLAELEASKPSMYWVIKEAVEIAVAAAEQLSGLEEFVEDKKQYALNIVQIWLDERGWDEIDVEILEAAIEAEVLKQFPK